MVVCTYRRPESVRTFLDSLATQDRRPDAVFIVDASPDDMTAQTVKSWQVEPHANSLHYWHVDREQKGLTRQRNFALRRVPTDLVAFFDDDVVLSPNCVGEMERIHRLREDVVGVGCFGRSDSVPAPVLWRVRRLLRIVPALQPGKYYRSGMAVPWDFDDRTEDLVEGDWLPGFGMMWKTAIARQAGFNDKFAGYAQGEDLDFSLRLRRHGKLVIARRAELRHLPDPAGRPNPYRVGYMEIYNRYQIHRRGLPDRTARDVMWFVYAWTLDTLMLSRHLLWPSRALSAVRQIAGRLRAAHDVLRGR